MATHKPSIIAALASFAKSPDANAKQAAAAYTAISVIAREAAKFAKALQTRAAKPKGSRTNEK
jgi:hypothetical protein